MNVFLSYTEADKTLAWNLSRHLRSFGYEVLDPASDIEPGANWHLKVGRALEEADAMVVLLTQSSVSSSSVRSDIDYALTNERFQNRLIPVLGRPSPSIPWILEKLSQGVMIRASTDLSQTAREIATVLDRKKTAVAAK